MSLYVESRYTYTMKLQYCTIMLKGSDRYQDVLYKHLPSRKNNRIEREVSRNDREAAMAVPEFRYTESLVTGIGHKKKDKREKKTRDTVREMGN